MLHEEGQVKKSDGYVIAYKLCYWPLLVYVLVVAAPFRWWMWRSYGALAHDVQRKRGRTRASGQTPTRSHSVSHGMPIAHSGSYYAITTLLRIYVY